MTPTHDTLQFRKNAIFNTIGYIVVVVVNAMAVLLPINGQRPGEISASYPTLFTPANVTFSIWSVIYATLLCFIIYQCWLSFSQHADHLRHFMRRMKGWWLLSCMANACWIFAWHYHLIPVAFGIILVLLITLVMIHRRFHIAFQTDAREQLFIHVPFSLYLGWISIATLANFAVLMVYWGFDTADEAQIPMTNILICIGTVLAVWMILWRNNITHGLVAMWAFYGILMKRREESPWEQHLITEVCIISMGIIAIAISWQLYRRRLPASS